MKNTYQAVIILVMVICTSIKAHAKLRKADGIAAIVESRIVKISEIKDALKIRIALIYRDPSLSNVEKKERIKDAKKEILEELIERELILTEFGKMQATLQPEYVENDINRIIREKFKNDRKLFERELKKAGLTHEQFREMRYKMLVVQAMKSQIVGDIKTASEADARKAYQNYKKKYRGEDKVHLHTIAIPRKLPSDMISEKDQLRFAQEVRTKIVNGADFGQMARTYSVDAMREKGGDQGVVPVGKLSDKMQKIVSALGSGDVSPVSPIDEYFYIIYISKKIYGKAPSYSELKDKMKQLALQEKKKAKYDKWIEQLKKKYHIRRLHYL